MTALTFRKVNWR